MGEHMRARFYELLGELVNNKKENNFYITDAKYKSLINEVQDSKSVKVKQTVHYRRLKRFDILKIGGEEKLISPVSADRDKILYYVSFDELFQIIHDAHIAVGHGGRTRILKEVSKKYKNVTVEAIVTYLKLCETCKRKQKLTKKVGNVVKPILHGELNSRCQIDLIDMQAIPDGDMKFIMVYQDHLTKFVILRSLRGKTAEEVANILLDIFVTFGAPNILHSDNGREFCNSVIKTLCEQWVGVKIVHGRAYHSQSQGSVERANQDVENMLGSWMEMNNTEKWSKGLGFVQAMKNRAYHAGINCSPYEAMFGVPMKLGITSLPGLRNVLDSIHSEEDLESAIKVGSETSDDRVGSVGSVGTEIIKCNNSGSVELPSESSEVNISSGGKLQKIMHFRKIAKTGLEKQARKMVTLSSKKMEIPDVGQSVTVKVPNTIRAKTDPKSVMAIVTDVRDDGLCELGTKHGKLSALYETNQFTVCKENFLKLEEIPPETKSLLAVANKRSLFGSRGSTRCNCLQKCKTNRCVCKSINRLCNTKCHGSKSCCNK